MLIVVDFVIPLVSQPPTRMVNYKEASNVCRSFGQATIDDINHRPGIYQATSLQVLFVVDGGSRPGSLCFGTTTKDMIIGFWVARAQGAISIPMKKFLSAN